MTDADHADSACPRPRLCARWLLAGGLVLAGVGTMSLLSGRLSPGVPGPQRPLLLFVLCHFVAWAGYALAFVRLKRVRCRPPLWFVVTLGLLARAFFLPSDLIQSDDCYRYILDGHAMLAGLNPYAVTPAELQIDPPQSLIANHGAAAVNVIARVNNADVPTIYPPLALAAFAAGARLAPWQILGQRLVFLFCDLLAAGLLLALLQRYDRPRSWIALYLWNPLVIKEISNTVHVDSLPALWLVLLVAALALMSPGGGSGGERQSRPGLAALAGVTLAGAILAKLYPLILLPACVVWVARRCSLGNALLTVAVAGVTIGACYWPFLGASWQRVTEGLRTYGAHWINNPGAFMLLELLFDSPRAVYAGVVGLAAVISALVLLRADATRDHLLAAFQITLLTWLLLGPACFPWYAVGLLAISVLRPTAWAVMLSGAFGLFYAVRFFEYHEFAKIWTTVTQSVEHGLMWLSLGACAAWTLAKKRAGRRHAMDAA